MFHVGVLCVRQRQDDSGGGHVRSTSSVYHTVTFLSHVLTI